MTDIHTSFVINVFTTYIMYMWVWNNNLVIKDALNLKTLELKIQCTYLYEYKYP